jgi:hypothetical protein
MKSTMAIRVQQNQISEAIAAALTLRHPVVNIPPGFLGDQLVA